MMDGEVAPKGQHETQVVYAVPWGRRGSIRSRVNEA